MATSVSTRHLSENGALIERHWQELNNRRRLYTWLGLAFLALTLVGS
ncbi:MAG: phosphonate ABC transporter, permease protein PhnE, partial [Sinorhizobium meliloti]|nr:phosphonate ABC transporter, permease protein PhnE [Sinorhizobium meliloti]